MRTVRRIGRSIPKFIGSVVVRWINLPLRSGSAMSPNRVDPALGWDDKPRLLTDGRVLFFISGCDGIQCIWRQQLTVDMHANGAPEPVYYVHTSRDPFSNSMNLT